MKNTDDVHKTTEAVYKNLVDNFNKGMYQISVAGKAYYKALQGVAATAHAYNDALSRVGSAAKLCKGGTGEIGDAVLQIAEAQKEIQAQLEESTKSLFKEVLLPLEMKLDKEFKMASSEHRKYLQGHKATFTPYNKAYDSLKKFRKKTKNKFVYDTEKEAQYVNTLSKCQRKLDEYRLNGLRIALLEERKCHCFLLQRLCATSSHHAIGHSRAVDIYASLPEWRQTCADPNTLPQAAEQLLRLDESYEQMNGGPYHQSQSAVLHRDLRDTQSLGNPFRRSSSVHDIYRQSGRFDGTSTLPPGMVVPPPPTTAPQIKAIYSFTASVASQLSFAEGDIIAILGEKSEGWQYGQNTRTNRYGWFPLSFTQSISSGAPPSPESKALSSNHRFKSMGDLLDSRSLSEHSFIEQDIPGNIRRPKSLYDGPSFDNAVCTAAPISTIYQGHAPVPPYPPHSQYTPAPPPPDPDQIYQPMPVHTHDVQSPQVTSGSGVPSTASSGYGSPARQHPSQPPPPPLPMLMGRHQPKEDYGGTDDDMSFEQNPMFSSVSLRHADTNDRSAPRIN